MVHIRLSLVCVALFLASLVARIPVAAQSDAANAYIGQFADSALVDLLTCEPRKATKWVDAMRTIASDSDMVCLSQCLRSCVNASNGNAVGVNAISNSIRHFAYRRDHTAQVGLAVSYCALGYYDYECSTSPNDIYFKKAERLLKDAGEKRFEAISLAFRTQMYIRAQRFVEASYCARSLLSLCNDKDEFLDLEILARLYMLRVYSAVRMEPAVSLIADAIEVHPLFSDPVFAAAYSNAMAVDRIRTRNYGEANVYSWGAFRVGNKYSLSRTEMWNRTFIRAISLFNIGHVEEAQALADSCRKYSGIVASHVLSPFESLHSLALLQSQIEQAKGNSAAVKRYIDGASIPAQLMNSDDFVGHFYALVEQNAVARGDFKTARDAVLNADSVSRHSQLVNTRIICKDVWLSTQEDSLVVNRRVTVQNDEVKAEGRKREVWAFALASFIAALSFVCYGVFRLRRKDRAAWQAGVKLNEQLASEIDNSTKLVEEQNALISKRNLDMAASRTYAKRMQRGIWPNPEKLISMGIPYSFVLKGTTENISSCFYWYRKVGSLVIVCCADSGMGNSVAGAMLSVVGLTIFNDAASKLGTSKSAAKLLQIADANCVACMPDDDWRGGISISVAVVDTEERTVTVACASAESIVFSNGKATAVSETSEKVGHFRNLLRPVKDYSFNYLTGDSVFLFTKSFIDVTNVDGEHLGADRLKAIIQRSVKLPPRLYHDSILNEIMYWRSSRPFTDDVLLAGFSLP